MALGRGLDALFTEIEEAYDNEGTNQNIILEIELKKIKPNPYQPRKSFDEKSLEELSDSIRKDGLLQPIVVTEDKDGYIIIAGERRYRASKMAKLKTIRAISISTNSDKMREFALIENIQRDELNAIELAFAYNELVKIHEITHEELSVKIHKSRTHITNTIRLLQLSVNTQKALVEKKITAGHAKVLIGLDEKQQQLIVNSIIGQKLSVREVEAMIKGMKTEKLTSKKQIVPSKYDFSSLQEKFVDLGFKAKANNNKLTIEFEDESQIDNMLKWFS